MKKYCILVAALALPLFACEAETRKQAQLQDNAEPVSWTQWGRTSARNNVALDQDLPLDWEVAYDRTGVSLSESRNVRWATGVRPLSHRGMNEAPPAVANGKIFVGSSNAPAYIKELEGKDLGLLVCLREEDGSFLWQHSNKRLQAGKVHDWEWTSVCSIPYVEDDRLWYVSNRCEVVCLDTEGFHDGENDGISSEERVSKADADVIWSFDMLAELKVNPHNVTSSSVTGAGELIFLNTGNSVDWSHKTLPNPEAPSFIALNKHTGEMVWADNSPGGNIMHGGWASPAYGVLDGVPQVIFAGGDGWLYSFDPKGDGKGGSRLLWKFDCNPKKSSWLKARNSKSDISRNNIVGFPVIHQGLVYVATGQDPEHGSGKGLLLCIDPTKRGDVSSELVYNRAAPDVVLPPRRYLACDVDAGDFTRPNPNSALRWSYDKLDRCCATPAIADGLLVIGDNDGIVHCLDASNGEPHWTHSTLSQILGSPLIAGGHVYIGNQDGEVSIFRHSAADQSAAESVRLIELNGAVFVPPIAVNDVLYIIDGENLIAISDKINE